MSKILKGLNESAYRKYDANRTGFRRGPRDDERHDLDVQKPNPQEWALKINGKVWSKDGKAVTFDSKEKALKARQSLLARRPELEVGLVTRGGVEEAGTGLDIDRSIPGRTIARVSDRANSVSSKAKNLRSYTDKDDDYDHWSGKTGASIHDDEEDTFDIDYTGDEEGQLKEISNQKLAQYKTAAAADAGKADLAGDYKKADKRFSGIVKATKKQFANDTKNVKEAEGQKEFILYINNKPAAKYVDQLQAERDMAAVKKKHPQVRIELKHEVCDLETIKKISEGGSLLGENLGDQLKSKSIEALQQVKQKLEQQRMADLEQWEKDFKQNTVAKFTARQPSFMQPKATPVAQPNEKHSVLKARLVQLDKAIEKQAILDKMLQRLDNKGLLTPAIQSDTDTSMLVRDGASDNYVELNNKLDKALEFVKNRLMTNKAAFAKPKAIDENEELDENLHQWFKEKWVRFGPDGKIRGDCARGSDSEGKPKCLPQAKAHSLGKKGRASAAARKRREDPNPERSGKAINVNTKKKTDEEQLDELSCWSGYHRVAGTKAGFPGSCAKNKTNEEQEHKCPHCGGEMVSEELMNEKKDACYYKVKSRYKVWPSAYASGALVKCRKKGASNWGTGGKSNESVAEGVNDYLWHGSKSEHEILYPQQANDTGGKEESNKNAVYATPSAKTAIAMGLTTPESDTGMFPNDPQMVLFSGNIRKGQMVYLHKVPKDLFIKHNSREWYSKPGVEAVKPIEVVKVPVDQWLHLIRQATPQDLELRKKYMKEGVAEDQLDEKWSKKYKDSINCSNPKGFSQKAHCAGKQKNESAIMKGLK